MYTLYYAPDNASLIVRVVLEELGVAYNTWLVDRPSREQESETYRKLNPNGLIPVCIMDGKPVFETAAIVLALAERVGRLAPCTTDKSRPQFLKWLFFLSNTLHSDLRQLFYPQKYVGTDPKHQAAHRQFTSARLLAHFDLMESEYSGRDGVYMGGKEPSIVDIYLALCLRWPQLYPLDSPALFIPGNYPALLSLLQALEKRPAFARAFSAEGIPAPFLSSAYYADGSKGSPI